VATTSFADDPNDMPHTYGWRPGVANTPFDLNTWIPRPSSPPPASGLQFLPDPAVINNNTGNTIPFQMDGTNYSVNDGNYYSFPTGSNSANYRPRSICFDNGQGVVKSYTLPSGNYHFEFTQNGLDLFRN
jgi:hypothetical protein